MYFNTRLLRIGLIILFSIFSSYTYSQCSSSITTLPMTQCNGTVATVFINVNANSSTFGVSLSIDDSQVGIDASFPYSFVVTLSAGIHIINCSDNLGCQTIDTIFISDYLGGYATTYLPSCSVCLDGVIIAHPTVGVPPYSGYWIHNLDTSNFAMNLNPGIYQYIFTDSLGCSGIIPVILGSNYAQVTVLGKAFFDSNTNGIYDSIEYPLINKKVILSTTFDTVITYTNYNGNYFFLLDTNSSKITFEPDTGFTFSTDSTSYSISSTTANLNYNLNFGIKSDTFPYYNGSCSFFGGRPRCNTNVQYRLSVTNKSNIPLNGSIKLILPSGVQFIAADITPTYINNDTVFWLLPAMQIFQQITFSTTLQIPNSIGLNLNYQTIIHFNDSVNNLVFSDTSNLSQTISCSWDPNAKQVSPINSSGTSIITKDDFINYSIQFQNTGNDTAINVIVIDTLSSMLDVSTFEFLGSSHNSLISIQNNVLVFHFNNILLPDSNINEVASHGLLNFRIKPLNTSASSDSIQNTASIFFDANQPIITNSVTSYFQTVTGIYDLNINNSEIKIFPIPTHSKITIQSRKIIRLVEVYSPDFRLIQKIDNINLTNLEVTLKNSSAGVYMLKIADEDGVTYHKILKL